MKTARILTDDFNRIIAATKDFLQPQSAVTYYEFKFIKLEFDAESSLVTALATDGYKMSIESAVISNCEESFSAYVSGNIKLPAKQYATITLETIGTLENSYSCFIIRCDTLSYGFKQPVIENPVDRRKFIPTEEPKFKIGFNANYLLAALKAAKASCGNAFNAPIVLEFTTPLAPVVFRSTKKSDIKFVLPIRLKEES